MITYLKRWLRSRRRTRPIIRLWDAEYKEISLPRGVKIEVRADDSSVVAYKISSVDLRRRADDE